MESRVCERPDEWIDDRRPAASDGTDENMVRSDTAAELGVLAAGVDSAIGLDLGSISDADVVGALEALERNCRRLDALRVELVDQIDKRGDCTGSMVTPRPRRCCGTC